ncbi:MAG: CBS domain-containing protein [Roseburia sp.]|nr:CBS domain-containing protein [Anaeroplasma bactoclasticum]MCM1196103.1 CBS domain-containing protein [Roseburia sp.]MCM1557343.1 CBS domain-containing protein [Anaeroplasma bactoclasticum]
MNIITLLTPKEKTFYLDSKSTIRQALEKYDYHKFTVVPLIDKEGHYITTLSEGDILRYIKNNSHFDLELAQAQNVDVIEKYRPYKALDISSSIQDVVKLAFEQNFVPMVDDRGMYIGIIKRKGILKYFYENFKKQYKL